jgi:capsular exopolysaccharide synthesis family protein
MSVDDAFRRLMEEGAVGPAPAAPRAARAESAPTAAATAEALAEYPSSSSAMEAPPPAPEGAVEPLDLSRVQRLARLAYAPIDPNSQVAEEYRILRTRMQALAIDTPSVLLTSCHHAEGKTHTAMHLALAMARRRGSRILLLDLDLRRPRLHRMMGLPRRETDIVSVLRGKCDPEEAMLYSGEDNLYVLCARREYSSGTDYLDTAQTEALFARFHQTFDFVLVDSSPCLSTSDPGILGQFVGGMVLVVRCQETQRESIQHAISTMRELGVETVGVILTHMRFFLPHYLYRYHYYKGYYDYGGYVYNGHAEPPPGEPEEEAPPGREEATQEYDSGFTV